MNQESSSKIVTAPHEKPRAAFSSPKWSRMKKTDLNPHDFPDVIWEPGKYAAALSLLCAYAAMQATEAINWYYNSRKARRIFCRFCRVSAIVLTAIAGALPLIDEILLAHKPPQFQTATISNASQAPPPKAGESAQPPQVTIQVEANHSPIHPLWSAVALAVAATLIVVDRFYGFTSGWVRYLLTAQQLTGLLEAFHIDVARQKLSWGALEPAQDQAKALVTTVREFCSQMRGVVSDETKTWAAEFADVLKEIDDRLKTTAQVNQKGVLTISVTNGDQCANGWALEVDDRSPEDRAGKDASVQLLPGIHIVRVSGEIAGKKLHADGSIKLAAGEIAKLNLTLA